MSGDAGRGRRARGPRREAVQLEIAGLAFRVLGTSGASRLWLRDRYRPFLSRKAGGVTLHVAFQPRWPRGRPPGPSLRWDGDRFQVHLAACRAEGALDTGQIRLRVPPVPTAVGPSLLRLLCAIFLLPRGGFLLHASGVVHRGHAWVFCGPSESGKTTIARLGDGRPVLSDETVAVARRSDSYAAFATPFFGEGGPTMGQANTHARLRGLCFLHQAAEFSHRRLSAREAVERAFPQVFLPKTERAVVSRLLGGLAEFTSAVPCYDLFFPPCPDLWEYLDGIA